jgi:cobalt-zinc-cadmium efflux system outer membrane protein
MCLALGMLHASLARAQTIEQLREWTLEEVLKIALVQHPLVEAAQARITAAEGSRVAARTFPNPVGTLWMENATFPGQRAAPGVDRETAAYFTLPLEPLFQRKPRVRQADELVKAAGADLTGERRQVALEAAHAFYRLALAQIALDAADENRAALDQLVSYNRTRVSEGASAEIDLIRVQVEFDRAVTNVALARVDLAKSWAELRPFLGPASGIAQAVASPVPVPRMVVPAVSATPAALSALSAFIARARENRPELLAARARVSAAEAETAFQRTLSIRQVGATFGLKRLNGGSTMIAGISVPIPVFDRNRGEIQRAASETIAAERELAWADRRVEAEVQGIYDAAQQLAVQAAGLQRSFVDRAADSHRITLAAYQEGATSLLQVLDASRTLADARLTYYRMVLAQQQSVFDLALAAGTEPIPSISILHAPAPSSDAGSRDGGGHR